MWYTSMHMYIPNDSDIQKRGKARPIILKDELRNTAVSREEI